ncbi:MAG TPA: thermonuclease family protein [Acetobacteraceae bacterium]|nr:thermonuclease family protein [Acetobacteraceae bacterium]
MLPRRRIFRPLRTSNRLRGVLAVFGLAGFVTLVLGIGLPGNLLGSAPREQSWAASMGETTVLDGETLRLRDFTVRLKGVAAPQRGQWCRASDGHRFDCGAAAADALSRLLAGRGVTCRVEELDSFGRGLARCEAGGVDLNHSLVAAGFALASGSGRGSLAPAEHEARAAGRGLWSAGTPESWRARR